MDIKSKERSHSMFFGPMDTMTCVIFLICGFLNYIFLPQNSKAWNIDETKVVQRRWRLRPMHFRLFFFIEKMCFFTIYCTCQSMCTIDGHWLAISAIFCQKYFWAPCLPKKFLTLQISWVCGDGWGRGWHRSPVDRQPSVSMFLPSAIASSCQRACIWDYGVTHNRCCYYSEGTIVQGK